jgi:hypothetical protein
MKWQRFINIIQFFDQDKPFEQVRDQVVAVLKADEAYSSEDYTFIELVDELAETNESDYFDAVMYYLYNWADDHRVWFGGLGLTGD